MSVRDTCARIQANAKAKRDQRNAKSKSKSKANPNPKVRLTTDNSATIEQAKRHRYSREEWSERQPQSSRRTETVVDDGGWATMGKSGKTRQVNQSESGEIRAATVPTISPPVSPLVLSQTNNHGWAHVVVQRPRKPEPASQLVISGKRVTNHQPAVRAPRGWVTRVSKVAGCSHDQSHVELQKAAVDCNGRPGSRRSRAILSAAANSAAPALEMPTTQNTFNILGGQVDSESLFPILRSKKTEKPKVERKKIATAKELVLDTTGMDEIDAALALIEAERRAKITKDVAKARTKQWKPESGVSVLKPANSMGAWSAKSRWVKKPTAIPRKVTFAEPEVFLFDVFDIAGKDQEWQENVADREYDEAESHPGYPAGMTGWGDQALWDEENGW